jgi:WD40 repeat protein
MVYREFERSYDSIKAVAPFLHCGRILGANQKFNALIDEMKSWSTVSSVCYSPDGRRLASGFWDGKVSIWDAESGSCLSVQEGVESVCYSPDGRRLASGSLLTVLFASGMPSLTHACRCRRGIKSISTRCVSARMVVGWRQALRMVRFVYGTRSLAHACRC